MKTSVGCIAIIFFTAVSCSQEVPPKKQEPIVARVQDLQALPEGRRSDGEMSHLKIEPAVFRACDSQDGAVAVRATWDVASLGVKAVSISVGNPQTGMKLWLEGGASGNEITGKWVFNNTEFVLKDLDTGAILGRTIVVSSPCT